MPAFASNTIGKEIVAGPSAAITPFAHATPAGTARLLLVTVHANTFDGTPNPVASSDIQYGGVALTLLGDVSADYQYDAVWYMVAPPVGAANVTGTITLTNGTTAALIVCASSFDMIDQDGPFGSYVTASGVTTAIAPDATLDVPTNVGELVFVAMSGRIGTGDYGVVPPVSQVWQDAQNGTGGVNALNVQAFGFTIPGATGSVLMTANDPGPSYAFAEYSFIGVSLRPYEGTVFEMFGNSIMVLSAVAALSGPIACSGASIMSLSATAQNSTPSLSGSSLMELTATADSYSEANNFGASMMALTGTAEHMVDMVWELSGASNMELTATGEHHVADGMFSGGSHFNLTDIGVNTHPQIDAALAVLIPASHARQHSITSTPDHTSTATNGKILQANANGLPVDATNTDAEVAYAVAHPTIATAFQTGLDQTNSTTFQEITRFKVNLLAMFPQGFVFTASMWATTPGATGYAELRIYDITTAAQLALLTSTVASTTPTIYDSGTITPANAVREYAVELRRQAGSAATNASVRGAWGRTA
jgi:hypothetical protein